VEIVDSRRLGGAWTLDRVWERLGIGAAIRRVAAGRRLDGDAVERVVFALVAQRALEPASKLAATGWVADRVVIEALETLTDDQAYWAMDFLLDALEEIAGEVFASVAHLLNLDLEGTVDDDGVIRPAEQGKRTFGHSKDFRTDLPQVVIAMAVTRDGVPVRCWTFPGNTTDTAIIRTVTGDLDGWNLHRMVWVADRGFASAANRAYLTRGGGHSRPRREAAPHHSPWPPPRSPAQAATAPWQGTCASRKSTSPPVGSAMRIYPKPQSPCHIR